MVANKFTKADIVDSIYNKTGINRKDIRDVVDLFIDEIKKALVNQMVIELRGFGTFEIRIRKGRKKARNPRTGEFLSVGSHGIAAFRAGRELKQEVWNLPQEPGAPGGEGEIPPNRTGSADS
jgi:integration host factor subunit beta